MNELKNILCRHLHPTAAVVALATLAGNATADLPGGIDPVIFGESLVRLRTDTTLDAFLTDFNALYPGTTVEDSLPAHDLYLLDLPFDDPATSAQLELQFETGTFSAHLVWGELNYEGQAGEGKTDSLWLSGIGVNFGGYQDQYGLDLIGTSTAHQRSTGIGTVVAILDTGIDASHPALDGKVMPGFNFVLNTTNTADVGDGADTDFDGLTDEMVGHGTFTAGIVHLVAPEAKLLPVTVLNGDGIGDAWEITKGLHYAIDMGVEVINMSLGSTYKSQSIEDAVELAKGWGIVVVGAAGNFDTNTVEEFPAWDNSAFGVVATDHADVKGDFSNYGEDLLISAPGVSVEMPGQPGVPDPSKSVISLLPDGEYATWSGTSFANAFVSGAAAIVRAQYVASSLNAGNCGPGEGPFECLYDAIEDTLAETATDIYAQNPLYEPDQELGAGRLDAGQAVQFGPVSLLLGDLNSSGTVDGADLGLLLAEWGETHSPADLDGNGMVNGADLGVMLGHWAP